MAKILCKKDANLIALQGGIRKQKERIAHQKLSSGNVVTISYILITLKLFWPSLVHY